MDWSSSQSKLATTSKDNDLKIWRVDVGKIESRAKGIAQINLVSYSELIKWCPFSLPSKSNGEDSLIAHTRSTGQRIQIMDTRSKDYSVRAVNLNDVSGVNLTARSIDFNSDGLMMVLANTNNLLDTRNGGRKMDSYIKVYDLRHEKVELISSPQIELASDAKFTPDGQYIMALGSDGKFSETEQSGSIRTSREGSRNSRLVQICCKGQTRNVIGEFQHPGIQHWDSVLESSSTTDRTYTVTTVLKRISSERGEQAHKARSNYYDIILAKYEMNTLTDQDWVKENYVKMPLLKVERDF